jgi:phenylalanine-4-hydroxylase
LATRSTQDDVIRSIPSYLRQFVVRQEYGTYTEQDHAVWRYVMRRNLDVLRETAHPAYLEGLHATGIGVDRIPHIDEMNEALGRIGWRAVVVDGFVPPAAFMEFQAHRILVISADIRHVSHIHYTPAPDIIHEAAGHAPLIAEPMYAEFLRRFGEYGSKAVFSKADTEIYEAIRYLSILKEYPDTPDAEMKAAETDLAAKTAAYQEPSESALLSRLHWWTVEYGLMGTTSDYRIFGAGILSSVGESKTCMDPTVAKIPLSVECSTVNYDITTMQPQLFVARDFNHLLSTLETFADGMCFRKGGWESARALVDSGQVGTIVLDSGLQVSGLFTLAQDGFVRTLGPTALAYQNSQLIGHGIGHHADGFSSPLGRLTDSDTPLHLADDGDLLRMRIVVGHSCRLLFGSGFELAGTLSHILRKDGRNLVLTFRQCTVRDASGGIVFHPDWGVYDLAVGEHIVSAFSGSADKENFNVYPPKSARNAIPLTYSDTDQALFARYRMIRTLRETGRDDMDALTEIADWLDRHAPEVWLARFELLEISRRCDASSELCRRLEGQLASFMARSEELDDLITAGYRFIA